MELSEFLAKRLDEDEDIAKEAKGDYAQSTTSGEWTHINDHPDPDQRQRIVDAFGYTVHGDFDHDVDSDPWWTLPHIARHDPARVLREVAAKRALLAQAAEMRNLASSTEAWFLLDMADNIERQLAVPYVEHSEFEPAWRVE